jgi:NAD(P)-dependent dehydrogenase (short-subunit alcohol dehydrogenase family)/uncharacterized OB-fold protein
VTEPIKRPPRKNPVLRTRLPVLPPWQRSRIALGLTAGAAVGRFELQVCAKCGTTQYPPREACVRCLGTELAWRRQPGTGELIASTLLRHSHDVFFRERLPWRLGMVRLDAGPTVVVHLHGDVASAPARVRVGARLDKAGMAVLVGFPEKDVANMADDRQLREMTCDPKFRKALVTDGRTAVGQAIARGLVEAGADIVWVGQAEPWKRAAGLDALAALPQVTLLPLDLTDERSVNELAAEIGGKVDILINNAEHHRAHGIASRTGTDVAQAEIEINYLGLLRLAQAFGPAMRARRRSVERSCVGQPALGVRALQFPLTRHLLCVQGGGALALAMPARGDARGRGARHQSLPGANRRRVEPDPAAAEARAGGARPRGRRCAARRRRGCLSRRCGAGMARALAGQPEGTRTRARARVWSVT